MDVLGWLGLPTQMFYMRLQIIVKITMCYLFSKAFYYYCLIKEMKNN